MITVFRTLISTFIQVEVPRQFHRRILSLHTITIIGPPSLGGLGAGALAEFLGGIPGAPHAVLTGGIIVGAVLPLTAPSLRKHHIDMGKQQG